MVEVYIVSGFLGAGKTTWIQRLLAEAFQQQKVVLIENDFGQASVDAALLKHQGVTVTEINAGCICCSLSGDFVKAIGSILQEYAPDVLLIEPSGVGKLSDVRKACEDVSIQGRLHLAGSMTVVDATRFALYQENFGEFFEDQIRAADAVLLSHGNNIPEQATYASELVNQMNPEATLFATPWDLLPVETVLGSLPESPFAIQLQKASAQATVPQKQEHACCHAHGEEQHHEHDEACCHAHAHDDAHCHQHDHECHVHDCHEHNHQHTAEDVFETLTVDTQQSFTRETLRSLFQQMEANGGNVVRAKGILRGERDNWNVQYVTGQVQIEPSTAPAGQMAIIGRDLRHDVILSLFANE